MIFKKAETEQKEYVPYYHYFPKVDYFTFRTRSGCEDTLNDVYLDFNSDGKTITLFKPNQMKMHLFVDALEYYLYVISADQDAEIRVEVHEE